MRRTVTVINDELGTIALGFSRAGYEVSDVYLDTGNKDSVQIWMKNWGDTTKIIPMDEVVQEGDNKRTKYKYTNCVAAKIKFSTRNRYGTDRSDLIDESVQQLVLKMIKDVRPESFLFHYNKVERGDIVFRQFIEQLTKWDYRIVYQQLETNRLTGFPVKENRYILVGIRSGCADGQYLIPEKYLLRESIDIFLDKPFDLKLMSEFYEEYRVSDKTLRQIERGERDAVLCWNGNAYKAVKEITWNAIKVPIVVQKNQIRKITHREIARLKGIPENYHLSIRNKGRMYQKLMNCVNVLVIQKLAQSLNQEETENYLERKVVSKESTFLEIMESYFNKKNILYEHSDGTSEVKPDFILHTKENPWFVECRIYLNNHGIERHIMTTCEWLQENRKNKHNLLIVGNTMDFEVKHGLEKSYGLHIWDVSNLLWLLAEFPQLQSDFVSLLSFSVADILPEKPVPNICETKTPVREKEDFQERLRKIRPGKEDAVKYEKLCEEITRYLFSDNMEFFGGTEKVGRRIISV